MSEWRPGPAWMFCPANRPDRYAKALDRADVVIFDLEDAVPVMEKSQARNAVRQLKADGIFDDSCTVLRVNAVQSAEHQQDMELARELGISRVMVAKAENASDLEGLHHQVVALVETPLGVEHASDIARSANVIGLMWGADDLVAGLGGTASRHATGQYREVARYARTRTLIAAKAFGRLALDGVHMDIGDVDGLREECLDAVAVGFDGTVAIHPSQVPTIRSSYLPSEQQVAWATRLLEAAGDDRGVTTFEGRMVDGPVYKQAERLLHLARHAAQHRADG